MSLPRGFIGAMPDLPDPAEPLRFVIPGRPATKKNSRRVFRNKRTGGMILAQSAQSCAWEEMATVELLRQKWPHRRELPFTAPVNVRALVYRDRDVGDLVNYLEASADALQAAGIVKNDKLIEGWDGSRPLIDRERPRVEIEITLLE